MNKTPSPFTAVDWTSDLAVCLADAVAALGRLDARISVSSFAPAWKLRASWTGYAAALQLQQVPLEEIDIIAEHCGLRVLGRGVAVTTGRSLETYPLWLEQITQGAGRHWREDLPFAFAVPKGWDQAPAIVRAFAVLDAWATVDGGIAPWLGFPILLRRMGIAACSLPCIVVGDPGQRTARTARPVLLKRLCTQLRRSAEDGMIRLDRFEESIQRAALAISHGRQPVDLLVLARLALSRPCLAARNLAPVLGITVSCAGKLLERAAGLGILVEASDRTIGRIYVTPDVALAIGLVTPPRGRPAALPPANPATAIVLLALDAEMAEIDADLRMLADG